MKPCIRYIMYLASEIQLFYNYFEDWVKIWKITIYTSNS